jgi:hephaestin
MKRLIWMVCLFGLGGLAQLAATAASPRPAQDAPPAGGQVRTYYIAAEETDWDYAPLGIDIMTGQAFQGTSAAYTQPGPKAIGHVYRKAIYREYTDATFSTRKPRPPQDEYLGLLGPTLRAEVGDTIKVIFKNNASRSYSIHMPDDTLRPRHPAGNGKGLDAEGLVIINGEPEDLVRPGATTTYEWAVPELAGPAPGDPSSTVWVYSSQVDARDVHSGLLGPVIVTRRGQANPDGTPKDVDREVVALFNAFNENASWYVQENVAAHISAADQDALGQDVNFSDSQGYFTFAGTGFIETNFKFSVNGYLYGDGPVMTVTQGERVRWYLLNVGDVGALNFHTPHWHGNTVLSHGTRRDTIFLLPLSTDTADMVPDAPGLWMFHCHLDDHMEAGMMARYEVLPAPAATADTTQRTP